jgi:hypothetical protein
MNSVSLPIKDPSLFFICRLCTKMAEQIGRGETVCHHPCGGPRKGRAFPLYTGPMANATIETHCFVCGVDAEKKLKIGNGLRELGVCIKHLIFAGIDPKTLPPPKTEDRGVVQKREVRRVSIYEMLNIDPVKDLGFKEPEPPEEKK